MIILNIFCSSKNIGVIGICKSNFNPNCGAQSLFSRLYTLLYSYGFTLCGLYGMSHCKNNLETTECDAIFVGEQTPKRLGF